MIIPRKKPGIHIKMTRDHFTLDDAVFLPYRLSMLERQNIYLFFILIFALLLCPGQILGSNPDEWILPSASLQGVYGRIEQSAIFDHYLVNNFNINYDYPYSMIIDVQNPEMPTIISQIPDKLISREAYGYTSVYIDRDFYYETRSDTDHYGSITKFQIRHSGDLDFKGVASGLDIIDFVAEDDVGYLLGSAGFYVMDIKEPYRFQKVRE
jgi:hypothetical protein